MEKPSESLYIKVLVWAYNRKQNPFKIEDLYAELNIIKPDETLWVRNIFVDIPLNGCALFSSSQNSSGETFHLLSDSGMSSAIGYLGLEESKSNSKRAEYLALWALGITSVVGVIQIVIALCK
ncbi:MAG: hypothetical protein WC059_03520 [Candidatus Paceibacterota bacterium]